MHSSPVISIIVPVYNYGQFLGDCLNSVLVQDFEDWECIVIDDGSTDNTALVIQEFVQKTSRFIYYYQANSGLSSARNTGMKMARGKFIQLLDADDGIAISKLRLQSRYLDDHADATLVFGPAIYFNEAMPDLLNREKTYDASPESTKLKYQGDQLLHLLIRNNIMAVSSPLFRSSLMDEIGLFDPDYKSYEDWQFWFRAAISGACFHKWPVRETTTYIRQGHSSMMRHLRRMNEAGLQIRSFMKPYLTRGLAMYNQYRIWKLLLKKRYLRFRA